MKRHLFRTLTGWLGRGAVLFATDRKPGAEAPFMHRFGGRFVSLSDDEALTALLLEKGISRIAEVLGISIERLQLRKHPANSSVDRNDHGLAHMPDEGWSTAHRKPMCPVVLSGVFEVRAATRYRLQ